MEGEGPWLSGQQPLVGDGGAGLFHLGLTCICPTRVSRRAGMGRKRSERDSLGSWGAWFSESGFNSPWLNSLSF